MHSMRNTLHLAAGCLLLLACTAAATVVGTEMKGDDHHVEGRLNCTLRTDYAACNTDLSCAWCGPKNQSAPTAFCYERGAGQCCATNCSLNYFCMPPASICTEAEVCIVQLNPSTYDPDCQSATCCAASTPVACGAQCFSPGTQCCDTMGGTCNATSVCCGTSMTGLSCCNPDDSICCSAPDGYDHWCCPKNQQCSPDNFCEDVPPIAEAV